MRKGIFFEPCIYSDNHLIAMIIGGKNAEAVAENVVEMYGNYENDGVKKQWYDDIATADLLSIDGVTERAARAIMAALELGKRIQKDRAAKDAEKLNDPRKVFAYFRPTLKGKTQEEFHVCYLNAKNQLLGTRQIAIGNIAAAPVDIKEILRWGIRYKAYGIILVHNHPSGDPTPSDSDIRLTRKTAAAAELMDMRVLDHVIIGRDKYTSLHDMDII